MGNETETAKKSRQSFWVFNLETGVMSVNEEIDTEGAERARPFSFKIERYKDKETHLESMQITSYIGENENGKVYTSIDRLGKDIFLFKRYGVVIGDTYFRDLEREIQKWYLDIKINMVELDIDKRLDDLIEQVKEYGLKEKLIDKDLCYIPVGEFDKLAAVCGFEGFEMQALRKQLKEDGMISCAGNRNTRLKKIKGSTERVIAFYKSKIDLQDGDNAQEKNANES